MPSFDFATAKIVIVDDQEAIRATVRVQLRRLGVVDIWAASHGPEALSLLRAEEASCLICDINMRPMNGLQVVQQIRSGEAGIRRDLPIAMLTAHSDVEIVGTALALDVNGFILKPVSVAELGSRLTRVLTEPVQVADADSYAALRIPLLDAVSEEPVAPAPPAVLMPTVRKPAAAESSGAVAEEEETGGERMALSEVPAGSTLARDIRADNGTLLLAKGRTLNRSMLNRLGDLMGAHDDLKQIWVIKP
jgi:two-component system, chemotaxis family, chemotaxis protein CheY